MLRNCLAAAWRNALHDRFYALLNVFGFALGLAAVILIWLFVRDELSFNRFLSGYQDVYRVQLTIAEPGQRPATWASTPDRMAGELKLDFPEIAGVVRDAKQSVGVRHGDVSAAEAIDWVDPDFLTVIGYPLLRGDPATALAQPDTIVLSRTLAQKYFGTLDCIGRTLDINQIHPIRVTGIADDPPPNSSVKFIALASGRTGYGKLAMLDAAPQVLTALNITVSTFVRLRPGAAPESLADRLHNFAVAHYPSGDPGEALFQLLYMNSLAVVHLYPFNPDTNEPNIRMQTLYAVAATGLLILLLAGVNFVNLVTARATRRAVEIGMRKALGARRGQLLLQFMGESIGYALVAMLLAMGLATLFLPYLNAFLDRGIAFDFWRHPLLAAVPIEAAMLLGAIAGVYPAVILSRFRPAQVLKAGSGGLVGGGRMRLGLVVFQFTVTIALLIATTVIYRQISFATTKALRFEKDLILTVDLTGMPQQSTPDGLDKRETAPVEALRTQMTAVPGVRGIAAAFVVPLLTQSFSLEFSRPERVDLPAVSFNILPIDFGYFGLYRVPLLAGRDFSREFAEDKLSPTNKSRLASAIVNETAMRALGFTDPSAVIGQEVQSADPSFPERRHRIVGVVPDFPLGSIRNPVPPSIFIIDPEMFNVLNVKLSGADLLETLRRLDAVWLEFVPERPINRVFLDDRIAGLYLDVTREGRMFAAFAAFAMAIGCLGLVGLSAYTAERRTKEIGVRKALGASTTDVVWLLTRQFTRPVLVANVLSWPLAWYVMRGWLDGFAYRIDLDVWPFMTAGAAAIVIAVATTAFHAVQAARSRPITALRYE
ncbi:MAG TPA: ABC transporter permease [Acetobacteraceae bacterium]|nr:ABC transporter permease [Acetobacteraceae bacterium]